MSRSAVRIRYLAPPLAESPKEFVSGLDKAVKKGVIAKNAANRRKSRAQLKMNKMAAK